MNGAQVLLVYFLFDNVLHILYCSSSSIVIHIFLSVDCASKRKLNNQSKDGHYTFHVAGPSGGNIELLIYCHDMDSASPKEYLSLPGGKQRNYISASSEKINGCPQNNGMFV